MLQFGVEALPGLLLLHQHVWSSPRVLEVPFEGIRQDLCHFCKSGVRTEQTCTINIYKSNARLICCSSALRQHEYSFYMQPCYIKSRLSPFAVLHMALFPKHPRRCLRSGHGVPPFLGGTDTWRLLSVLPTPHEDVHDDQGPHDPTTQSMAAREWETNRLAKGC